MKTQIEFRPERRPRENIQRLIDATCAAGVMDPLSMPSASDIMEQLKIGPNGDMSEEQWIAACDLIDTDEVPVSNGVVRQPAALTVGDTEVSWSALAASQVGDYWEGWDGDAHASVCWRNNNHVAVVATWPNTQSTLRVYQL